MRAANKVLVVVGLLWCSYAQAQVDPTALIEQRIEAIAELLEEDVELDYTTLFDLFSHYIDHPLNLNAASEDDLANLLVLSDLQIHALLGHIAEFGKLKSLYELQAVRGMDVATIRAIAPFVTVQPASEISQLTFAELWEGGSHDMVMRYHRVLEQAAGFVTGDPASSNSFLGDPGRVFFRYRYRYKDHISLGFTAEKDPGETLFKAGSAFDYASGHLLYQDQGLVRKLVLGDYQIQFGQGLNAWSGLALGKSSYTMQIKRRGQGIRPYTSVDENRFMRGSALTLGWKKFEATGFFSRKRIDANVTTPDSLASSDELIVSSFQQTGLHRTSAELLDRKAIDETLYGGHVRYKSRGFSVGASVIGSQYGANLQRDLDVYNQFDFNASENLVMGADYHLLKRNANFFGEVSRSRYGGVAWLQGVLVALHEKLSASLLYRDYARDYHNTLGLPFGELSRPANERGVFVGLEWRLNTRWKLAAYADQFEFPWMRFRVDAPSSGVDRLIQLSWKPSRKQEYYIRYRGRIRERNSGISDAYIDQPVSEVRRQFRINASYHVAPSFRLKTRMEWITSKLGDEASEHGFLFYQDLIFKRIGWPVNLSLRYALFDTQSWDTRVYAYENDLLFTWSIPPYYGRGARFYVMSKWRVAAKFDITARYSEWFFTDRNTIGSGLNEIQGNTKREVKVQLRWRF